MELGAAGGGEFRRGLPVVAGGVVWLIAGRTRGNGGTRGPRPGPSGGRGPRGAPDDDDDFLRGLK